MQYQNSMYSDRQAYTNSVDPDETPQYAVFIQQFFRHNIG